MPLDFYADMLKEQAQHDKLHETTTGAISTKRTRKVRAGPGEAVSEASFAARIGQFVVFRRTGEHRSLDPDLRMALELVWEAIPATGGVGTGLLAQRV